MVDKNTIKRWMLEDGGSILHDPFRRGIITGYVTFTCERAKSALENNTRNRKLNTETQASAIIESLENGWWDPNVSKINFDDDGTLSDGQHRLFACAKSGIPMRILVTWGVGTGAQRVTDRRGVRQLKDDLSIAGYKSTHNLAAMSRLSYLKDKGVNYKAIFLHGSVASKPSDIAVYHYFLENKDRLIYEQKLASKIYDRVREIRIPGGVVNVLSVEFDKISHEDADEFWRRLSDGIARSEGDPILLLRKRLIDNSRSSAAKLPNYVIAALIIKAWNFYEKGESIKQLKFTSGGANPEAFPEIYNPYLLEVDNDD